jgi:hypothetical protein
MYNFIGRIYKQQIVFSIIKLQLLYLNCIIKLPSPVIKVQTTKSRLPFVMEWLGY